MNPNLLKLFLGLSVLCASCVWWQASSASASSFKPPSDNAAPRQGTGGASRGAFIPPPDQRAPRQSTGGASRGAFIPPPDQRAPRQSTGGASRGAFIPPPDQRAPRQSTGGASRGEFIPPSSQRAPQQGTGGSSRGEFIPPSNQRAPQQTSSGASRSEIYGVSPALSAGFAMRAVTPESFYGTTLTERPTIMAYLPASMAQTAIFSLKDEAGNLLYRREISVSGQSEILAIAMSADAPALEIDANYQWFVTLQLDHQVTPNSPFVGGWIKRIEPDAALATALAEGDQLADAELLAEHGVWYDSAALFAKLYGEQRDNAVLANHWQELLSSVRLQGLVSESIAIASLDQ